MRVKQLEAVCMMLSVVRTKLQYSCCPVNELIEELDSREDISILKFINPCANACRNSVDFPIAWRNALGDRNNTYNSKSDDVESLISFGDALGTTAIEGQLACCDLYKAVISENLASAKNNMKKYSKLFPALGILGGIAGSVIVI